MTPPTQSAEVRAAVRAWKITTPDAGNVRLTESEEEMRHFAKQGHAIVEYAAPSLPVGLEVLAKVWFHDKPEEQDYELFDAENFKGSRPDCGTCVEALIVKGSHAVPTLPAGDAQAPAILERLRGILMNHEQPHLAVRMSDALKAIDSALAAPTLPAAQEKEA